MPLLTPLLTPSLVELTVRRLAATERAHEEDALATALEAALFAPVFLRWSSAQPCGGIAGPTDGGPPDADAYDAYAWGHLSLRRLRTWTESGCRGAAGAGSQVLHQASTSLQAQGVMLVVARLGARLEALARRLEEAEGLVPGCDVVARAERARDRYLAEAGDSRTPLPLRVTCERIAAALGLLMDRARERVQRAARDLPPDLEASSGEALLRLHRCQAELRAIQARQYGPATVARDYDRYVELRAMAARLGHQPARVLARRASQPIPPSAAGPIGG